MSGELGQREWKVLDFRTGDVEDNPKGGGQLQKFWVDFEGSPDVYWRRKLPATVEKGQTYFGTISEGKYGPMFKKETPNQGSGHSEAAAGTKSSGSEVVYAYPPSPEVAARMGRAHAQEMAVRTLTAMGAFEGKDAGRIHSLIDQWTTYFEEKVDEAGKAAGQTPTQVQGAPHPAQAGETPSHSAASPAPDLGPAAPRTTDHDEDLHRLDDALCDAAVTDYDERRWLSKAWEEMPAGDGRSAEERRALCLGGLISKDVEAQAGAVRGLRKLAGPMPESFKSPEDDIPF